MDSTDYEEVDEKDEINKKLLHYLGSNLAYDSFFGVQRSGTRYMLYIIDNSFLLIYHIFFSYKCTVDL